MTVSSLGSSACALTLLGLSLALSPPGAVERPPNPRPGQVSAGFEIPSPESWVPFEAEYREVGSDGRIVTGRFHRDAAGSTRLAIEAAGDTPIGRAMITIVNIPGRVGYLCSRNGVWSARALRVSAHSSLPRRLHTATSGLSRLGEPFEGHDAYRLDSGRGPVEVIVADLNFFAVRLEWREGPRQLTEFRRVRIGEQPADLFRPPPGATIRRLEEIGTCEIELEVTSPGGGRDRVPTSEGQPVDVTLLDGRRYLFETGLMDELRFVVGVKVYLPLRGVADEAPPTLIEDLVLESWRPAVTTTVDPPLEIRLTKVGGRAYSLLRPGIY